MTYPYAVKYGGTWYRPNENVPDSAVPVAVEPVIKTVAEPVTETADESADIQDIPVTEDAQTVTEAPKKRGRKPSKT